MAESSSASRLLDPLEYDAMFGHTWSGKDVAWWKRLAERHGGPGLELGSGTGRITLRLAGAGVAMTGLDREPAMVEHARRKSRRCGLSSQKLPLADPFSAQQPAGGAVGGTGRLAVST